jgi:hypothetical protein
LTSKIIKKISGKRYRWYRSYWTKKEAEETVKGLRHIKNNARMYYDKNDGWVVYYFDPEHMNK